MVCEMIIFSEKIFGPVEFLNVRTVVASVEVSSRYCAAAQDIRKS